MEQTLQYIPWAEILKNPNSAWALVFIVLLIITMWQNSRREERYIGIVEGTLREITSTLQTVSKDVCEIQKKLEAVRKE